VKTNRYYAKTCLNNFKFFKLLINKYIHVYIERVECNVLKHIDDVAYRNLLLEVVIVQIAFLTIVLFWFQGDLEQSKGDTDCDQNK
jgi:hypothetical protein